MKNIKYDKKEIYESFYKAIVDEIFRLHNKIEIRLDYSYDFSDAIDRLFESIFDNNLEDNGLESLIIDDKERFILLNHKNLIEWSKFQASEQILTPIIEAGYNDMFVIYDSIKEIDDWSEKINKFLNSEVQEFDNSLQVNSYLGIQFGEELALIHTLYQHQRYLIMTREEGIKFALKRGIDIKELKDY